MTLIRRDIVDVLKDLPPMCAARLPSTNEPIYIKRGTLGYWSAGTIDPDTFNARQGITPAQVEAMLAGSMFGFDCPGADPLNCQFNEPADDFGSCRTSTREI